MIAPTDSRAGRCRTAMEPMVPLRPRPKAAGESADGARADGLPHPDADLRAHPDPARAPRAARERYAPPLFGLRVRCQKPQ